MQAAYTWKLGGETGRKCKMRSDTGGTFLKFVRK